MILYTDKAEQSKGHYNSLLLQLVDRILGLPLVYLVVRQVYYPQRADLAATGQQRGDGFVGQLIEGKVYICYAGNQLYYPGKALACESVLDQFQPLHLLQGTEVCQHLVNFAVVEAIPREVQSIQIFLLAELVD